MISDREKLELLMRREGLTQPQTDACMTAADEYAFSQVKLALTALGHTPPLVHYLHGARIACGKPNRDVVNTTVRDRVTCEACKQTDAWKKAA